MKAKDRQHLGKVAAIGCIVCINEFGFDTPPEIHHIANGTMGKRNNNFNVIPLCHLHHRTGGHGVAVHQGRKTWEANFGTEQDLLKQVMEMIK
jgi:hypothetical protein